MDERLALITPQLDDTGFDQADMIVEAVFENMAVKQAVFAQLDTIAKPDCVLATNTSSLDIDQIAHVARRPHMVIGLHFFSPANVMKLVEVVPGKATAPQVLATAFAVTKRLNKIGVWAGNTHGFIGNRMMHEYVREAELLVEDGASIEDVNQTLFDFGMAMGPLAMEDLVGIDIMWRIRDQAPSHPTQTHHSHSQSKALVRKPVLMERLFALHRYGQKNGKGWSKYDENRKASSDPEVVALIEATAQEIGITRRAVSPQEIIDRCILALVNEGAKILEEGMALRAVDIDMVYLNGYGFPAWRGGPMFYADTIGLPQVLARIREFEAEHGSALWKPAALLVQLAESGNTFSEYDKSRS
jgi:3-hydroxyacyl-CoA dehydrogenase